MFQFIFTVNFRYSVRAKHVYFCRLLAIYDQLEDMGTFGQISIHFVPYTCCYYIPFYLCTDVTGRDDTR